MRPTPPTSGDIKVRSLSLYATPLAVVLLPEAADLNSALAADLRRREAASGADGGPVGGPTAGRSSWDLLQVGPPAVQAVIVRARAMAADLTSDAEGKRAEVAWRAACRGVVLRAGQAVEAHADHGAFWSGLYYVDDGGAAAQPTRGGALEFQDPRGAAPVMYAPDLTFAGPGGATLGISQTMQPRAGALAVFPSWLLQSMSYYRGDGTVIALAFTLCR